MIYFEEDHIQGKTIKFERKFVVVSESNLIFCLGIYDNYYEAFGHVMDIIYESKENYKADGDEFTISDPFEMEGESGWGIETTYKYHTWGKSESENYYILFNDVKLDGAE